MHWGLLGPEQLAGSRRTRALGVGRAVRKFNQLAVPGLGGVWFAKQLLLATLGVVVADRLRLQKRHVKAIEIANAIEALACFCAFQSNGGQREDRLRGVRKLVGKTDLTFAKLRQPRYYVTQPMRMATVEALAALGFVESTSPRFNSFRATEIGRDFVEEAMKDFTPFQTSVELHLFRLASEDLPINVSTSLQSALSPLKPLNPIARELLRSRICEAAGEDMNARRRKNALNWVSSSEVGKHAAMKTKPQSIDPDHWNDLRLGARFFEVRNAAIDMLNVLEAAMDSRNFTKIAAAQAARIADVQKRSDVVRAAAQTFLQEKTDPTGGMATEFCRDCFESDSTRMIEKLVARDGRVLLLRGTDIHRGPAFLGRSKPADSDEDAEGAGAENVGRIPVPANISPRISNLYLMNLDLHCKLDGFLLASQAGA